jgi:hypothetical protein
VPEIVTTFNTEQGETSHFAPEPVQGTDAVLFTVVFGAMSRFQIEAVWLGTGRRQVVLENAGDPHMLSSGHLLFRRADQVLIAPFDARRLLLTGPTVPLVDDVRYDTPDGTGSVVQLAVSPAGTLAYVPAIDSTKVLGRVSRAALAAIWRPASAARARPTALDSLPILPSRLDVRP